MGNTKSATSDAGLSPARFTCDALDLSRKGTSEFYLAAIGADEIFPLCYVSRAEEDPEKGYQRLLGKSRANAIAHYLDSGKIIPGAIILSAQSSANIKFDKKKRQLSFEKAPRAFLVIDGQHRLYGGKAAKSTAVFPVSILCGLTLEAEAEYFNDINGSQKGVPKTLQLEIEKFTTPKDSLPQIRIKVFHELNTRPDSPLANRLSATKSVPGKLTQVPFKNAIEPLLGSPAFRRFPYERQLQLIINFLKALEDMLISTQGDSKKLSNAAFFQAAFNAFPGIMQEVIERHHNYKEESFRQVMSALEYIDWDTYSGTNRAAIEELTSHILDLVKKSDKGADELFE